MSSHTLPKAVTSAINSHAFHMANREAYEALRNELLHRANLQMQQPHATVQDVIAALKEHPFESLIASALLNAVQTPAPLRQSWPFPGLAPDLAPPSTFNPALS